MLFAVLLLVTARPELVIQVGHSDGVTDARFSPDEKYIATAGDDYTAKLWDVATGRQLRTFVGHDYGVTSVRFSPDGSHLITGGFDGQVISWDVATGKEERRYGEKQGTGYGAAGDYSGDGKLIVVSHRIKDSSSSVITLHDAATGKQVKDLSYGIQVYEVSTLADGEHFVVGSIGGVSIFRFSDLQGAGGVGLEYSGAADVTRDLATVVTRKGNSMVIGDLKTSKITKTIEQKGFVFCTALNPDATLLASCNEKNIDLRRFPSGELVRSIGGLKEITSTAKFSKSGALILVTSSDGSARLYEVETGRLVQTFRGEVESTRGMALTKNGDELWDLTFDGRIHIWDLPGAKQARAFASQLYRFSQLNITSDGRWFTGLTPQPDDRVWQGVFSVETGERKRVVRSGPVLAFSPDGRFMADGVGYGVPNENEPWGDAGIWDAATGKRLFTLPNTYRDRVSAVAFSPDSQNVAFGWMASTTVYDPQTGKQKANKVNTDQGLVNRLHYSDDGKWLVAAHTHDVTLRDAATNELVKVFGGNKGEVRDAVLSADNKLLAAGGEERVVRIYDVETGAVLRTLTGHTKPIRDVAFLNDGTLLSLGEDLIKRWRVSDGALLWNMMSMGASDYAIVTPDNYYTASKGATKGVHFVDGSQIYTFENFDLLYNRPDIVLSRLPAPDPALVKALKRAWLKRLAKAGLDEKKISEEMHVPTLNVTSAAPPLETKTKQLKIELSANDTKVPLDHLTAYVNDVPAVTIKARGKTFTGAITIELSNGDNKIQVAAMNSKGAESIKHTMQTRYTGAASQPTLYLATIGVSKYADEAMALRYAAKDATDVAAAFRAMGRPVQVLELTNELVTKEAVLDVKKFFAPSKVDDVAMLFVAGHGLLDDQLDWYFATSDIDFQKPEKRGVSYEQLEGLLDGIGARQKLLLMDACHSGEVDKEDVTLVATKDAPVSSRGFKRVTKKNTLGLADSFELMQELFASVQKGSGAQVISSASGAEYAFESPEWTNGVFTYALLEGLKSKHADGDKDGSIRVSEVRDYVQAMVRRLTQGKQNPTSRKENAAQDFRVY